MNLVETYVYNIVSHKQVGTLHEIIADTDCYGTIERKKKLILTEREYEEIKNNGYYLK